MDDNSAGDELMKASLYAAPTIEPITLNQLKLHLRSDSQALSENIVLNTSIAAGSHPVVTAYTLKGAGVNVLGKRAVVFLQPVNNGTGGTVDVKIQESDTDVDAAYADWTGGAFTQVTEANDTVIQEKEYTGVKGYIRVIAKTLVADCEFGVSIMVDSGNTAEDDLLTEHIQTAREHIEETTHRALLTQTWDYYLNTFPSDKNYIKLPFGNLQSVSSVKYKDSDGVETTLTENTDYIVETNGEGAGRIVLLYGESWPTFTAWPSNPVTVRFVCGWTTAANLPSKIRTAIKMICTDLYENREGQTLGNPNTMAYQENKIVQRLLYPLRLWDEY